MIQVPKITLNHNVIERMMREIANLLESKMLKATGKPVKVAMIASGDGYTLTVKSRTTTEQVVLALPSGVIPVIREDRHGKVTKADSPTKSVLNSVIKEVWAKYSRRIVDVTV